MGKGGGSSGTQRSYNESKVTQSNLPEYARPYYERMMQRAEAETYQPYTSYPGARLAGFTPDEKMAFGMARDYAGSGVPQGLIDAGASARQASGIAGGLKDFSYIPGMIAQNYDPSQFNTNRFIDAGIAQRYMNPFTQNVLDIERREAGRRGAIERQGIEDAAAKASAFGGYRHGLELSEQRRNEAQLMSDIEARGMRDAYDKAMQAFMTDEGRSLQAQQLSEQSKQYGATYQQQAQMQMEQNQLTAALESARTQLQAAQTSAQAAQAQSQIAALEDQIRQNQIQLMQQTGYQQRELGQAALDQAYNDFINQRDYERQNVAFMSGILHGVPVTAQSEVVTSQPAPSQLSQLLGAGIGSVGLAGLA